MKEVGGPGRLFSSKMWDDWKTLMYREGKMMFGHGRAATRGSTTVDNAHPFVEDKPNGKGKIILVHNGTLHDYQELDGMKKFDVDSHWLTHCLATHGAKTTFEKVNGPMACIYYDTEEETINVFRNIERPLAFVKVKTGEYIINSELAVLMFLKYQFHLNFERDDVKEFKSHTLYSMPYDQMEKGWVITDLPKVHRIYPGSGGRNSRDYLLDGEDDYEGIWGHTRPPYAPTVTQPPWKNSNLTGERTEVPHAQWNLMPRSYEMDIEHLFAGRIKRVEFLARARKTVMPHGEFWTENVGAYKPFLHTMELNSDGSQAVMKYHDGGGSAWVNERPRPAVLLKPPLPAPKSDPLPGTEAPAKQEDTFCLADTDFRVGKKKRFKTTLSTGKKIDHWAKVTKTYPRHFEEYWNAHDDRLTVGDTVRCEIYDVRDVGPTAGCRVRCTRVRSPADKYVDFYFYDHKMTKGQLERVAFVEGKIQIMRLASHEEWKENGSLVRILLGNLEYIHDSDKKDEEESIIVLPDGVNPNAV